MNLKSLETNRSNSHSKGVLRNDRDKANGKTKTLETKSKKGAKIEIGGGVGFSQYLGSGGKEMRRRQLRREREGKVGRRERRKSFGFGGNVEAEKVR